MTKQCFEGEKEGQNKLCFKENEGKGKALNTKEPKNRKKIMLMGK